MCKLGEDEQCKMVDYGKDYISTMEERGLVFITGLRKRSLGMWVMPNYQRILEFPQDILVKAYQAHNWEHLEHNWSSKEFVLTANSLHCPNTCHTHTQAIDALLTAEELDTAIAGLGAFGLETLHVCNAEHKVAVWDPFIADKPPRDFRVPEPDEHNTTEARVVKIWLVASHDIASKGASCKGNGLPHILLSADEQLELGWDMFKTLDVSQIFHSVVEC